MVWEYVLKAEWAVVMALRTRERENSGHVPIFLPVAGSDPSASRSRSSGCMFIQLTVNIEGLAIFRIYVFAIDNTLLDEQGRIVQSKLHSQLLGYVYYILCFVSAHGILF